MKKIDLTPRHLLLLALFILVAGYALFQARFLILGPQVDIEYPRDGESLSQRVFEMRGMAHNISWISLNGEQIFTDEKGSWSESLAVNEGVSIMTVSARDRFGREVEKRVRVIFN